MVEINIDLNYVWLIVDSALQNNSGFLFLEKKKSLPTPALKCVSVIISTELNTLTSAAHLD